jgi:hypothetical protein
MLVQRWGILRTAMPCNIRVKKIIAMVIALAKLHNFCIGESEVADVPPSLAGDDNYILNNENGFVQLEQSDEHSLDVPTDLMDSGHHFDGIPRNIMAQYRHRLSREGMVGGTTTLPRTTLHQFIANGHWERPRIQTRERRN